MADEPEDPDAAADRLEAALERIARLAAAQPAPADAPCCRTPTCRYLRSPERLDQLIGRLARRARQTRLNHRRVARWRR